MSPLASRPWIDRLLWVAGGVLLGLPFLFQQLEWLVLLAPLPWLVAIEARREHAFRRAYLGGFVFILTGLSWLFHVHPVAAVAAAAYFALYPSAWAVMTAATRARGVPLWLAAPLGAWASETLVSHVTLFKATWLAFGYLAWRATAIAQVVDVVGVSGLSALLILCACSIHRVLAACFEQGALRRARTYGPLALALVLVAACWLRGAAIVRSQANQPAVLTVALVQGNIPQEVRVRKSEADAILAKHVRLSLPMAGRVDLIAWPESTANYFLDREPALEALLGETARQIGAPILVGALATNPSPAPPSNAAFLVTRDGIAARADKRVLVPGAETLLQIDRIPALREPIGRFLSRTMHFRPYLLAGTQAVPLTITRRDGQDVIVGSLVCYDDNVPGPSEELRAKGATALIVMSNEAWFGTKELDQHLAMATMRCIETRMPMGRATNTGRTCLIDACGRVQQMLPKDEDGVIVGDLPSCDMKPVPPWWRECLALIVTIGMITLSVESLLRTRLRRTRT